MERFAILRALCKHEKDWDRDGKDRKRKKDSEGEIRKREKVIKKSPVSVKELFLVVEYKLE